MILDRVLIGSLTSAVQNMYIYMLSSSAFYIAICNYSKVCTRDRTHVTCGTISSSELGRPRSLVVDTEKAR